MADDAERDRAVPAGVFLIIAAIMVIAATVYWFVSYEDAGTTMLALAAVLAGWAGGYLWLQGRAAAPGADERAEPEHYLPHASLWPFGIGAGAFFAFNGLLLGPVFLFPGAVLLVLSIAGWARQSRQRA